LLHNCYKPQLASTQTSFHGRAMNFIEQQVTGDAQNVIRKKERIETLEALLATHEAMGAEPDSQDVKELKERIKTARMQLMVMY
jgi:hypothetical protein